LIERGKARGYKPMVLNLGQMKIAVDLGQMKIAVGSS